MVMMKGEAGRGHPGSGRKNRRKVVSNPSTRGGRGMTHHHHHHSVEDRTWDVPSQSKQPAQCSPHHTHKQRLYYCYPADPSYILGKSINKYQVRYSTCWVQHFLLGRLNVIKYICKVFTALQYFNILLCCSLIPKWIKLISQFVPDLSWA